MTNKNEIISYLKSLNKKYDSQGFKVIGIFGSYARGTYDMFSDIDLTYKINHDIFYKDDAYSKLEKLTEIKKEIEKRFSTTVDLIPSNTSNKLIQQTIASEQVFV